MRLWQKRWDIRLPALRWWEFIVGGYNLTACSTMVMQTLFRITQWYACVWLMKHRVLSVYIYKRVFVGLVYYCSISMQTTHLFKLLYRITFLTLTVAALRLCTAMASHRLPFSFCEETVQYWFHLRILHQLCNHLSENIIYIAYSILFSKYYRKHILDYSI